MIEIILKIIPIILVFILGYVVKSIKIFKKEDGDLFLKVVFYIAVPALILLSITKIKLTLEFIYLPLIAILTIIATFILSFLIGKLLKLEQITFGVFLIGSIIMNTGFTFPFILAVYGKEGLAMISLFDFGNALLVYTFVYYLACKYGSNSQDSKTMIKKLTMSPPIWALIIAIILNLTGLQLPNIASNFFHVIGDITIPLIMLSLGIYFSPKIIRIVPLSLAIIIRMVFGLLIGIFFVKLFNLEGLLRTIVLIGSAAPVGYNTLTFSSLENLDKEFAASLVSIAILIGLIFVPLLMFMLS